MTTISVAMCACNREDFIGESLAAIAAQTRPPDELVVCDDVSTDRTPDIVRDFARTVPFPVRLLVNDQRLKLAKNYERAIGACAGDLIALCDDDDVWRSDKLRLQEQALSASSAPLLVFSDADIIDEQSRPLAHQLWRNLGFTRNKRDRYHGGRLFRYLLRKNASYTSTVAFRAELRAAALPIPAIWKPDWWLTTLAAACGRAVWIDEPLMRYRQHASNASRAGRKRTLSEQLAKAQTDGVAEYGQQIEQTEELRRRLSRLPSPAIAECEALLKARSEHLRQRIHMRGIGRGGRIGLVAHQLIQGNYHRFTLGLKSAVKDLSF